MGLSKHRGLAIPSVRSARIFRLSRSLYASNVLERKNLKFGLWNDNALFLAVDLNLSVHQGSKEVVSRLLVVLYTRRKLTIPIPNSELNSNVSNADDAKRLTGRQSCRTSIVITIELLRFRLPVGFAPNPP